MSMMFDALQALDASAGVPVTPVRAAARNRARPRRWLLLATGGGVLLTGSLLWAATRPTATVQAAPVATRTLAASASAPPHARIAPAPVAAAVAASHRTPSPAPVPQAPARPAPAEAIARTEVVASPAPAAAMPMRASAVATAHTPTIPAAALVAEISVRDASENDTPAEGQAVARLVTAINAAVHAGDFGSAEQSLAQLERELPPRSLTLLRMQAWVAHVRGDAAGALALYRRIAERMPSDQTVAINLAILEADNGQADSARARLQQLRADNVESVALERAILQVEVKLR